MKREDSRPKAIIFDFDNTLVDSKKIIAQAFARTCELYGMDSDVLTQNGYNIQLSLRENFPKLFHDKWREAEEYFYDYYNQYSKNIEPLEATTEMLSYVFGNEIPMAIISNKKGHILRNEINNISGWNNFFKIIIGSSDLSADKPSIIPVQHVCEFLNVPSSKNVWFVGDSDVDIKCANDSGCFSVLYGDASIEEKPKMHIQSHNELINHIRRVL